MKKILTVLASMVLWAGSGTVSSEDDLAVVKLTQPWITQPEFIEQASTLGQQLDDKGTFLVLSLPPSQNLGDAVAVLFRPHEECKPLMMPPQNLLHHAVVVVIIPGGVYGFQKYEPEIPFRMDDKMFTELKNGESLLIHGINSHLGYEVSLKGSSRALTSEQNRCLDSIN